MVGMLTSTPAEKKSLAHAYVNNQREQTGPTPPPRLTEPNGPPQHSLHIQVRHLSVPQPESDANQPQNEPQVTIAKECLGGREGWIIGRPPNRVLYGQPVDTDLPPELHWALMNGGTGLNPPPTLMMHSHRRAKEMHIDIREMPTPRARWAIPANVTFPDDTEHNLVGSATVVRPPTPSSPSPPHHRGGGGLFDGR